MMKKVILLLVLIVTFSCKDEKKKAIEEAPKVVEKQYNIVKSFLTEDVLKWSKTNVSIESTEDVNFSDEVYHLSRNTTTKPAYFASGLTTVTYASEYRVSVTVKKGENNNIFGLRISGLFPDRVDAIFDLEKGIVIENKVSQDFENPIATIEKLFDGWYNCTLSAEVAADDIRIIMGPTGADKKVSSWEGETENLEDIYFVPSSIIFEEVLLK